MSWKASGQRQQHCPVSTAIPSRQLRPFGRGSSPRRKPTLLAPVSGAQVVCAAACDCSPTKRPFLRGYSHASLRARVILRHCGGCGFCEIEYDQHHRRSVLPPTQRRRRHRNHSTFSGEPSPFEADSAFHCRYLPNPSCAAVGRATLAVGVHCGSMPSTVSRYQNVEYGHSFSACVRVRAV